MNYLSVCSGIEAATVAWHHMEWAPVGFSEIEPFPSAVLAHHYPNVSNLGDMNDYESWNIKQPDILVGGTPCQSFSVAGLRKGLHDPRGGLMLTYLEIAQRFRPKWIVWENVPGVLSSNGGRDFGSFLGALGELGYGWAYRVLDAQWFGVAQRRRRVFVVGCLGDQTAAAKVLFESESVRRNPAPSREKGKGFAAGVAPRIDVECIGTLTAGFGKVGAPEVDAYTCIPWPADIASTLNTHYGDKMGLEDQHVNQGCPLFVPVAQPVAFGGDIARTLQARHDSSPCADRGMDVVAIAMQVRRLTPVECCRLQGFPDGYTKIPWRGKPAEDCPDGPRYKALGNSMAVPVMRWIGERINLYNTNN